MESMTDILEISSGMVYLLQMFPSCNERVLRSQYPFPAGLYAVNVLIGQNSQHGPTVLSRVFSPPQPLLSKAKARSACSPLNLIQSSFSSRAVLSLDDESRRVKCYVLTCVLL